MTYVTLDIFEKFLRVNGIENEKQYAEAYRRKLIPTNLLPKKPSVYYAKPNHGEHPVGNDTRILLKQAFEKKYGRKYNNQNKIVY